MGVPRVFTVAHPANVAETGQLAITRGGPARMTNKKGRPGTSMAGEAISEQGAPELVHRFSSEADIANREEMLEILFRTDKLTAGKKGSLESTMMKTMESTEEAWNKTEKFQETKNTQHSGGLHAVAARRVLGRDQNTSGRIQGTTASQDKFLDVPVSRVQEQLVDVLPRSCFQTESSSGPSSSSLTFQPCPICGKGRVSRQSKFSFRSTFLRGESSDGLPSRWWTFQPCRMWRSLSSRFSSRTGFNSEGLSRKEMVLWAGDWWNVKMEGGG